LTPSVAIAPVATPALISTAVRDREWWAVEAVRAGTDWSGVVETAFEMMVAGGLLETKPETFAAWDAPCWCQAAAEYHRDRLGRLAVEIEPKRLARRRRLMAVSLERAWRELRDKHSNLQKDDLR
jgi:hypothetical protein